MESGRSALLQNHGLIVGGKSLAQAVNLSRIAEYSAHFYFLARSLGKPHVIAPQELDNILAQLAKYGQGKEQNPRS
jgi:L-fuculose-phosphate aldolase